MRTHEIDLDAIRKREAAATPGPWRVGNEDPKFKDVLHPHELIISHQHGIVELEQHRNGAADTAFIANARQDVPALLTEIDRLRAAAWKIRDALVGEHDKASHFLDIDDCEPCLKARDEGDPAYACDEYKAWQKAYEDALGVAIGPRPDQGPAVTRPNPSQPSDQAGGA